MFVVGRSRVLIGRVRPLRTLARCEAGESVASGSSGCRLMLSVAVANARWLKISASFLLHVGSDVGQNYVQPDAAALGARALRAFALFLRLV